jgi:hypothetical protein
VEKIIAECRRVNMRYRDPGWDIDWDLKYEKGYCLNSLGRTKFELNKSTLTSPSARVPKAVKRVHEIFEKPTFMVKVDGSEVKQGAIGDCWLMSTLSGLANVPNALQRLCVKYDTRIGIYGFVFYRDGEWIYSIIDDKLYLKSPCWDSPSMQRDLLQQIDREDVERVYRETYQTGSKALFFGQCKDQNETWAPLLEKAYAKAHGDYASLSGGWIGEGLEDLSGGVTTELLASDILDTESFWNDELSRVNEEFMFGCSTGLLDGGYGNREGISEFHAYIVMEARTLKNGTRLVKMRNPWGNTKGLWSGRYSDNSREMTKELQEELGHSFGNDSVFWIAYDDLLRKYQHIDRTRLFREADWRSSQRWIGVEVPWKPQYNEKFHIKITKETPLVLVLSQLDDRYFRGLTGQYDFRLHFRLHERGRPDAEDYVTRSHGNYIMQRSVSIEIPAVLPGEYTVFVMVEAERDTDVSSVDDVVRRELKKRVENEKLAQVGAAYDLAHSKGVAHLEAVAKARQKLEAKQASESRKAERRKMWETRHMNREIARKGKERTQAKMKPLRTEAWKAWKEKEKEVKEKNAKRREEKKARKEKEAKEKEAKENAAKEKEVSDAKEKKVSDAKDNEKNEGPTATDNKAEGGRPEVESLNKAQPPSEPASSDSTAPVDASANTLTIAATDLSAMNSKAEAVQLEVEPILTPVGTPCVEKTGEQATDAIGSAGSSETSGSPQDTPKSDGSATPLESLDEKVAVPPIDPKDVSGAPPAADPAPLADGQASSAKATDVSASTCKCACCLAPAEQSLLAPAVQPALTSSSKPKESESDSSDSTLSEFERPGDSSDSPVSDFEALYASDDMTRKPRYATAAPVPTGSKWREESEDDSEPDPWNAICIVGFRVYSKDEGLELKVVFEGGELEEGGMGKKRQPDLDNAQVNAGGQRDKSKTEAEIEVSESVEGQKKEQPAEETLKKDGDEYDGDTEDDKGAASGKKRKDDASAKDES